MEQLSLLDAPKAPPSKQCRKCGKTKSLDEFGKNSGVKDGLMPTCKPCTNAQNMARHHARMAARDAERAQLADGMKRCESCDVIKMADAFHQSSASRDGRQNSCIPCVDARNGRVDDGTKRCAKCSKRKPLADFNRQAKSRDGRAGYCRRCARKSVADFHAANPDRSRQHYLANRDEVLQRQRDRYREDPTRAMFKSRKRRARRDLVALNDWTYSEILASRTDCYLCRQPLSGELQVEHIIPLSRGGLDARANLAPVHKTCNLRKNKRVPAELSWYSGPVLIGAAARAICA